METKKFDIVKLLKIVIPAILAIIIANIAPPEDLTVESMRFAGLFVCMIIWMVLNVWPDFVITLVGPPAPRPARSPAPRTSLSRATSRWLPTAAMRTRSSS